MEITPRIGIVGCGYWGKNLVRTFNDLGCLHAVCDSNPAALTAISERYPVPCIADVRSLFAMKSIDAVVIASPAALHYWMVRDALESGKDVLVEKPLALSAAEGDELAALSKAHNRVLMVGHLLLYHPAIVALKGLIQAGELGKLQYVYSCRLNWGKLRTEEDILWSFAPHDVSALLYLLEEEPNEIDAHGGSYLNQNVPDMTLSSLSFPSGVRAHIFVSWLHPYKEQKLVIVGDRRSAVFDDTDGHRGLSVYSHRIEWLQRVPTALKGDGRAIPFDSTEPLRIECEHFLNCVRTRQVPRTDAESAVRVLRILEACEAALKRPPSPPVSKREPTHYFAHETAVIDTPCSIGSGTKIWHFSHVMKNSRIGKNCILGQNVHVAPDVMIGDNVKIQNNVSLYTGVELENGVFCGPSMVFTNVINPRSYIERKSEYRRTLVREGASIGANATIVCGTTIGRYAFVGAGAVVTHDVPDYALVVGVPARQVGWMCECGEQVESGDVRRCSACGQEYLAADNGREQVKAAAAGA